uniref:Nbr1 FW domain-containing protein n=1 Tax=Euplotes harpa TaxID=151035 RepID=A0A7S3N859_9SPIT|mmetsp:Transcript_32735/g.37397  ORF Transcript_32735/g.37397 Transcript_32735/m.37397 type:complete len:251 (+) Transcript_32735:270-1022(+)
MKESHQHPMLKFKFSKQSDEYYQDLKIKYMILKENKQRDVRRFTPKVIDSSADALSNPIVKSVKNLDDNFSNFKAELISTMPRDHYTIDLTTKMICLTVVLKNTGTDEWPSGFYVGLIQTDNQILEERENDEELIRYTPAINKSVKPNSTIEINVNLITPGFPCTFVYTLSLFTLSKIPFGNDFKFTFTVKNVSSALNPCYRPEIIGMPNPIGYVPKLPKPSYSGMLKQMTRALKKDCKEMKNSIKGRFK